MQRHPEAFWALARGLLPFASTFLGRSFSSFFSGFLALNFFLGLFSGFGVDRGDQLFRAGDQDDVLRQHDVADVDGITDVDQAGDIDVQLMRQVGWPRLSV